MKKTILPLAIIACIFSCRDDGDNFSSTISTETGETIVNYATVDSMFAGIIDLNKLANYSNQDLPTYITKDNTLGNSISNEGATLGRVLFYDKELSIDKSLSCGSCHKQVSGFGDTKLQSDGVNGGLTARHSMRLINSRFSTERKFFWDERANSLEEQTTMPIQDHAEMGFSGQNGNPNLNDLLTRLQEIEYYKELFAFVYGDSIVSETRIQNSLAQFIRSIQSFDSKFDVGLTQANNLNANFSNYTAEENQGKLLFLSPPNQGGAGCQSCHSAPEFDIDPNTRNNGVIATIGSTTLDLINTRAPSLRDVVGHNGVSNGQLMHDGSLTSLAAVIDHYNLITPNQANNNLDNRLRGGGGPIGGQGQSLNLTQTEKDNLVAFLQTLSGTDVYTNQKWSDPF
jgi:cytochrome c peroxidase